MKYFLASEVNFSIWKEILVKVRPKNAFSYLNAICRDNASDYDRAYAVIIKLVESGEVTDASKMEDILRESHEGYANRFKTAFLEGLPLPYVYYMQYVLFQISLFK